jgi:hypothetical protein
VDRPVSPTKKARKKRPPPSDDLAGKGVKPRSNAELPRTQVASTVSLGAWIARFLDEPQPILRIELIRIFAPLAVLGFMSSRIAHADEWLSTVGFHAPEIAGGDWRQPLYLAPLSPSGAWILAGVMIASGLLVSLGVRARAAALVFAATLAYVALADRFAAFTVSKLSPAVMLALAASPIGSRFGVDAYLKKRRDPEAPLPSLSAGGGPRFFQLLLPVFYLGSAFAKGRGDWLSHPVVLWTHLHDSYQTPLAWFLATTLPAWMWTLLQGVVFSLELGAPFWFANKKTRPYALLTAVGMHVMIALMFWPVRWFSMLMISMWLGAYLPDAWLTRWAEKAERV